MSVDLQCLNKFLDLFYSLSPTTTPLYNYMTGQEELNLNQQHVY